MEYTFTYIVNTLLMTVTYQMNESYTAGKNEYIGYVIHNTFYISNVTLK